MSEKLDQVNKDIKLLEVERDEIIKEENEVKWKFGDTAASQKINGGMILLKLDGKLMWYDWKGKSFCHHIDYLQGAKVNEYKKTGNIFGDK